LGWFSGGERGAEASKSVRMVFRWMEERSKERYWLPRG
jgi:hypothetical protein